MRVAVVTNSVTIGTLFSIAVIFMLKSVFLTDYNEHLFMTDTLFIEGVILAQNFHKETYVGDTPF